MRFEVPSAVTHGNLWSLWEWVHVTTKTCSADYTCSP